MRPLRRFCQVFHAEGVRGAGGLGISLGTVNIGIGSTVQYRIRAMTIDSFENGTAVRDVQPFSRERDDLIADLAAMPCGCSRDHPVCSGNEDLHKTKS